MGETAQASALSMAPSSGDSSVGPKRVGMESGGTVNNTAARVPSDSALVHFWRKVTSVGAVESGLSGRVTGVGAGKVEARAFVFVFVFAVEVAGLAASGAAASDAAGIGIAGSDIGVAGEGTTGEGEGSTAAEDTEEDVV